MCFASFLLSDMLDNHSTLRKMIPKPYLSLVGATKLPFHPLQCKKLTLLHTEKHMKWSPQGLIGMHEGYSVRKGNLVAPTVKLNVERE